MDEKIVNEYKNKIESVSNIMDILINNYTSIHDRKPDTVLITQWFNIVSGLINLTTNYSKPEVYDLLINSLVLTKNTINHTLPKTTTNTTTNTASNFEETKFDPDEPINAPLP